MAWLAPLFLLTALLYASIGFGGGSTYTALLYLADVNFVLLPVIALISNVIVVTGGTIRYARAGKIDWKRIWPIFTLSVPMAWLGGKLVVSQVTFLLVLGSALLVSGVLMLMQKESLREAPTGPAAQRLPVIEAVAGGGIGLLAGLVGIGGGIFLAPLLHLLRWGTARTIAGTSSVFILVNSLAGLAGQISKTSVSDALSGLSPYWLVFPAVLVGGQIGSHVGLRLLSPEIVRKLTAVLVLYVAVRLLWRLV